jgi:hypothetical protein
MLALICREEPGLLCFAPSTRQNLLRSPFLGIVCIHTIKGEPLCRQFYVDYGTTTTIDVVVAPYVQPSGSGGIRDSLIVYFLPTMDV